MLGQPLLRLETTDSTNRVALDWADAPHGAAVVARSQTGGRGRLGRSWSSPAGAGLYLSVVLRSESVGDNATLSLTAAVAVAGALEKISALKVRVKWPNDVLVLCADGSPRKVGGILCEAKDSKIVVGIGVNLNHESDDFPERPVFPASSLKLECGRDFDVEKVLTAVLGELGAVLKRDWPSVRAEFERKCFGRNEVVRVKTPQGILVGVFEGVGEEGALSLRTADGPKHVVAGDVSYF